MKHCLDHDFYVEIPSLTFLQHVAEHVLSSFSKRIRRHVVIKVDNFPSYTVIQNLGMRDKYELLGVQQKICHGGMCDKPRIVGDLILLYRCPIVRYLHQNEGNLRNLIRHILWEQLCVSKKAYQG